jgi:O-antigen/teichoic acid export membrane protein
MIIQTTVVPPTGVGRIELRASKPGSAEFQRTFAKMTQSVSLLSFPIFLGAAVLTPDLFQLWLNEHWIAGVGPMQFMLLSGIPLVLFYCIDQAFFAANQSRLYVRTSVAQTLTIAVTVLCAAPFGLDLTTLALVIRPWILLPIFLALLRHSTHLPVFRILLSPLNSLIGAILMAGLVSFLLKLPFLPLPHAAWLGQFGNFIFLIAIGAAFYFAYLYLFLRNQLKTVLKGVFIYRADAI